MVSSNESLSVWHWAGQTKDFIVAAVGVVAAARAFERVKECRDVVPQQFPETDRNISGRELATAHPGVVYRRGRRTESA
jgi:hypothetical protein